MSIYNTSFMDNSTNILQLMTGVGTAMGSSFFLGNMLLLCFFIIFLIMSLKHNFLEVLVIDGILSTILAILLFAAGMIAVTTIAFPAVIFMIALLFYLFS